MIRASTGLISPQLNGLLPNQKVRTTCNACQQAKIRCSHTHPCDRCVSHGFECVYSISQPLGRPAKKKGSRSTLGLQAGRTEGEGGRSLRRGAFGGAPRSATGRRQRLPTQRVESESNPSRESRGDSGTEVTDCETDLGVPASTRTVSKAQESPSFRDRVQDQTVSAEANNASGTRDQVQEPDVPFETLQDWEGGYDSLEYPHLLQQDFNSFTVPSTPLVGLMIDDAPTLQLLDREPSSLEAPGVMQGLVLASDASYHFCLAPNARQISGTIHHPWRIMELPSTDERHGQPDSCSSHSLSPERIDLEYLSADSFSTRCSCCQ